jgi:serine/threonine protein kinase
LLTNTFKSKKGSAMSDTIAQILRANCPEDVFGNLPGSPLEQLGAVRTTFRQLAQACHPDRQPGNPDAAVAFEKLRELRTAADTAIKAGSYGRRHGITKPIILTSRTRSYTLSSQSQRSDLADLYSAVTDPPDRQFLLKVAREAQDNELLVTEAQVLRHLRTADRPEAAGFLPMLPKLIESLRLTSTGPGRQVNAFVRAPGFYSLEQVREGHPHGLDPKHMAWMFRQLLLVLGYLHRRQVVHGAVLPHHVLIHPAHDLLLVDFTAAVREPGSTGAHIPYVSERYEDWYPPEVTAKQPPEPATDIAMAARCMSYLMAGQPVPTRIEGFLASCSLPRLSRRPQDAWITRTEFTRLIEDLWGPRRRIPFTMPTTKNSK